MAFKEKMNLIAKKTVEKTNSVVEITRLNMKLSHEKDMISQLKQQIGEYVFIQFQQEACEDEGVLKYCLEIVSAMERIAELEETIALLKGDSQYFAGEIEYCPVCHQPVKKDAYYCDHCGSKLK